MQQQQQSLAAVSVTSGRQTDKIRAGTELRWLYSSAASNGCIILYTLIDPLAKKLTKFLTLPIPRFVYVLPV